MARSAPCRPRCDAPPGPQRARRPPASSSSARVVRRLAGSGRFAHTDMLAREPVRTGLASVNLAVVGDGPLAEWPPLPVAAQVGLVMFEPPRLYYERERVLWTPTPGQLLPLAHWLRQSGVTTLVVVMPHVPGRLPEAIKRGLDSLDEHEVSGLGFSRVLWVRSAHAPAAAPAGGVLQRLAAWMLSIGKYMIPADEQPVRPVQLAEFLDEALQVLPPGTHVVLHEVLSRQMRGGVAAIVAH